MAQTPREELTDYLKHVGEHINLIYNRLKKLEARVDEMSKEIADARDFADGNRKEFNEFVNRLAESLKELLPPVSKEAESSPNR